VKHRTYVLNITVKQPDPALEAVCARYVKRQWDNLGDMREAGRSLELLFPVKVEYTSVERARPKAQKVKRL
jgi:hypothetical protein